jgi:hypothetical protein
MQAHRNAAYQVELRKFQQELRLGMPRSEVATYLRSHQIAYSDTNQDFDLWVGEDPGDGIVCRKWNVYVEMSFIRLEGQIGTSPFDNLDDISIRRIGTCL